jgi:hypothetical protein|tara:strand:- start:448 stop:1002 length:555 start_codon:yes stop_codon:yes gene_type:complete
MRYLPEHTLAFIHNPKAAGTSISTWLDDHFKTIAGRKHGHMTEVKEFFPKTNYTFGVIRNPWERLASWYLYSNNQHINFKTWVLERTSKYTSNLSFQPHLLWSRPWYSLDTAQHSWFGTHTHILRYETLEDDFYHIQDKLDCYKPLPKLNSNRVYNYKDLYTTELVDYVRDIYMKDLIEYQYVY